MAPSKEEIICIKCLKEFDKLVKGELKEIKITFYEMSKLEVGMFLRTNDGKITKFIKYDEEDKNELVTDYYEYSTIWIKDIIKASFDVIDLIEVGDYVNGYKITDIDCYEYEKELFFDTNQIISTFVNEEIKTIVTHEQMEQMSYKVGE